MQLAVTTPPNANDLTKKKIKRLCKRFANIWLAASQQEPPPLHADLLLADDRQGPWRPAAQLAKRQASGLFVSLPIRRAIARLVPSVCGTLPPREGGPHVRSSHRIVHHATAKQLPLS